MDVNDLLREGHKLQIASANRVEMSGDEYREMKRKADAYDASVVVIPRDVVHPLVAYLSLYSLGEMSALQHDEMGPLERQAREDGLSGLYAMRDKLEDAFRAQGVWPA